MKKTIPSIVEMRPAECRAMLRDHRAGRIAFTFKDRVDIEPISYVMRGQWLYGRTAMGSKLVTMKHNPWVAFEVDDIAGPFEWWSVVVHGTAYFLNPGGIEHEEFPKALAALRTLDARILTDDDMAPTRTIVFRIHVDVMTGRRATSRPSVSARKRAARSS